MKFSTDEGQDCFLITDRFLLESWLSMPPFLHVLNTFSLRQSILLSNQIKSLLLPHHHSTSALVSEILMSVLQTVQKNNRQFTYGQTVQKKTTDNLHMDRQCKKKQKKKQFTYGQTVQKTALEHLQCSRQCKKKKNNNSNLHMDRQCKKATAIYIWTVHITDCTEDNVQNTHTYTQYA